jgi:hypothetical protein
MSQSTRWRGEGIQIAEGYSAHLEEEFHSFKEPKDSALPNPRPVEARSELV